MAYKIILPLKEGWSYETGTIIEEGQEIAHFQAYLPDNAKQADKALIDIYAGPMPPGTDAEAEALASYADVVGFEDDGEEEDPLTIWPFQGKEAYGYEAICEDNSPMRVMTMEIIPGVLVMVTVACRDDALLVSTVKHVEAHLAILPEAEE